MPGEPTPRTVIVLPALQPDAAAKICGLLDTGGHLAPQPGCLLLVLGTDRNPADVAAKLSKALRRAELIQLELVGGYLSATRWRRGAIVDHPAPGLLANALPEPTIGLVHGSLDPAAIPSSRPIVSRRGSWLARRMLGR